jgi:hypothetical protein
MDVGLRIFLANIVGRDQLLMQQLTAEAMKKTREWVKKLYLRAWKVS